MSKKDFQELVNHSNYIAKFFLAKQDGEFYPFGVKIDNYGNVTNVGLHDGDEFPLSQTLIDELKKKFEIELKNSEIRSYAIVYSCIAQKNDNSEKTDAIGIECYSKEEPENIMYYYPYKLLINNELEYGEPWAILME